jgi:hypothetical protein
MEKTIEKGLREYIALIRKDSSIDPKTKSVMIAGLEAVLSFKLGKDPEEVVEELYQYLDKKGLDFYVEATKKLDELNSPVTASEIPYVIAGIESFQASKEFNSDQDKFDFLPLFKIFSKFFSEAAHLSSASNEEIDENYPGISQDIESTKEGKKVSRKYKFLARFFKILATILIMRAYIANAIARITEILSFKLRDRYKGEINHLRDLGKSIDKKIAALGKSIAETHGRSAELLKDKYHELSQIRQELASLYNKLQSEVKFDLVSNALNNKQEVFAPIFDPKNRETLLQAAAGVQQYKQDPFTGLTGILNTRSDLSSLRIAMNDMFFSINDALIIAVFATCFAISQEISAGRSESFVESRQTEPSVNVPSPQLA